MQVDFSDRHTYLGSSELGQALGISPFGTKTELWERKTLRAGPVEHIDIFDRGHAMEPHMVDIMANRYGVAVSDREKEFIDKDRPWLRCHVDGIIGQNSVHMGLGSAIEQDGPGIVEFKAPGYNSTYKLKDGGVPGYYLIQMHMNMYLSGCKWGVFVVMDYENWDIIPIYMELSTALVEGALPFIDAFWACVTQDIAPSEREEAYRLVGPTRTRGGFVKEDTPLVDRLRTADADYQAASAELEEAKALFRRDLVAENTDHATYTSSHGTHISVKWTETRGKRTVDGKRLLCWAEAFVEAAKNGNISLTEEFAQKFDPEVFMNSGTPGRRFTYKVKED